MQFETAKITAAKFPLYFLRREQFIEIAMSQREALFEAHFNNFF